MGKLRNKSIIQKDMSKCYVCGNRATEIHEIFFGSANRKKSIEYGCYVGLCYEHHRGNTGVHFNRSLDLNLKALGQRKFEEIYSHNEYMKIFKRNYL